MSEISVAIVNWNTRELLLRCLASVAAQTGVAVETLVVDNASTDGSADAVAKKFPEVVLIRNAENRGFAAATNQALARAGAPFWLLLNPDTELTPGALSALRDALAAQPGIWAAGPQLLNPDGSLQPSGRRFPTLGREALAGVLPEAVRQSAWWQRRTFGRTDFTVPAEVDEVSGACFLARREAWARVGPLDERFFLFYEEIDWFLRMAAAGGRVLYAPQAKVYHHWGAGMLQTGGASTLHNYRSRFRFWRKHGGRPAEIAARALVLLAALAGIAVRTLLTLAGLRPWRELAPRVHAHARVLALCFSCS
jgi:N-acetylglucosaminyl-diphospho-decaprenol L-rhamnosyltransferase